MIFKTHIMHPNNIDMGEFISCVAWRTHRDNVAQFASTSQQNDSSRLFSPPGGKWQCFTSYCFTTRIADLGVSPRNQFLGPSLNMHVMH